MNEGGIVIAYMNNLNDGKWGFYDMPQIVKD